MCKHTCNIPLFHKSFFSIFGASADPMRYSSPLLSATCPGRFWVSCPLLKSGCPKAPCQAPGALHPLRAVVTAVTLSSHSWGCLKGSEMWCFFLLSVRRDFAQLCACTAWPEPYSWQTAQGRPSWFWCKTGQENSWLLTLRPECFHVHNTVISISCL